MTDYMKKIAGIAMINIARRDGVTIDSMKNINGILPPGPEAYYGIFRKSLTLSRTSGAVSNYQMKIVVHRTTGEDSGENVYVGEHCTSNYHDLRFTKSNGVDLLDYWIETENETSATVWVEFDAIGTDATIFYMYYGYYQAESLSNGNNTFILFDDFERGEDGDPIGGIWTTNAYSKISTDHSLTGSRSAKLPGCTLDWGTGTGSMFADLAVSDNIAIKITFWKEDAAAFDIWHGNGTKCIEVIAKSDEGLHAPEGLHTGKSCKHDEWDSYEIKNIRWSTYQMDFHYPAGTLAKADCSFFTDTGLPNKIGLYSRNGGVGNDSYIDYIFVYHYRQNGPAWGAWGQEETL